MLTLAQIEPRRPITNTTAVTISTSGSYYLTANITVTNGNAIWITAKGVTLDLNGFTLSSTAASPSGFGILLATGLSDITIINGHITGSITYSAGIYSGGGFSAGIWHSNPAAPSNVRVSGVSISGCGSGVNLGTDNSTVVDSCMVLTVGAYGIEASTVTHSSASQCGGDAITANISSDCYGYSTGGNGFTVSETANNCYGYSIGNGTGLSTVSANNCYGYNNGTGIGLYADQAATGCYGESNSGAGLDATKIATGCSGNSHGNGVGLAAGNANNCYGQGNGTGTGLDAGNANNCSGQNFGSGTGLYAFIAIGCYGQGSPGSTGLVALVANSCYSTSGGDAGITYKYNMP